MKRSARDFRRNDVVYIFGDRDRPPRTAVVNRTDGSDMVNVFPKRQEFGVWFFKSPLKRIGGKGRLK
jgi:hypothetical protein